MPRGGATAYCSRVVCLSVCHRISRHSLKTKCWNLQHKQINIRAERILILNLGSHDLLTSESMHMAIAGDLTPLKTKLFTAAGCLTTSKFVCTTEQRDSSSTVAWMTPRHGLHLYFYLLSYTCYSKNNVMFLLSVECRFKRYQGWPGSTKVMVLASRINDIYSLTTHKYQPEVFIINNWLNGRVAYALGL